MWNFCKRGNGMWKPTTGSRVMRLVVKSGDTTRSLKITTKPI